MGNNCCGARTYKTNLTEAEIREIERQRMLPSPRKAELINKRKEQGGIYMGDRETVNTEKIDDDTFEDESSDT